MTSESYINETLKQKTRFISHEIKNQLSIIDVYTKVIQKTYENDLKTQNATETIFKSIESITKLLNDLKNVSNQNMQIYCVNDVVSETYNELKEFANQNCIELSKEFTTEISAVIDKDKFQNVILNIIKNAIEVLKETEKKEKFIEISLLKLNGNNLLRIANNGKKIEKAEQEKIFEEGYTTKKAGSGIGLYICKKTLREQCCDLKLLKSDDKVTVFEIEIGHI